MLSAVACLVSSKPVPLGTHGIFHLCKKPHLLNHLHSTATYPAPVDYSVTATYSTTSPATITVTGPVSPSAGASPQPEVAVQSYPPYAILYPPQHSAPPNPFQQRVPPYPPQPDVQDHQPPSYPPQQKYTAPEYVVPPNPSQPTQLYPPQPDAQDPSQQQAPPYPAQDVLPSYQPQQQYAAPDPAPQEAVQPQESAGQYQPQNSTPTQQQQQNVQYPPLLQPQQQLQNSPPYYQGNVLPSNNVYGPPDYVYYQPQPAAATTTNPIKKSLGHQLIHQKFLSHHQPYTVYVQQPPYAYDFYPSPLLHRYQTPQALEKPQNTRPVTQPKP